MKFVPRRLRRTADESRGRSTWHGFLKNVISVAIVFAALYLALGLLADLVASTIPDRWEARIFESVPETPLETADKLERATKVLERLKAHGELRDLPYRLFLIPSPQPNALALPGGSVGLTSGLLDSVESELGLAAVLGHELGHHQGRHSLKRLGRALIYRVTIGILFGARGPSLVDRSLELAESSYSRRQEFEADEFGLKLVHRAYGNTEGSLEFFELVLRDHEKNSSDWGTFLDSHPLTSERIANLKRLQATLDRPGG